MNSELYKLRVKAFDYLFDTVVAVSLKEKLSTRTNILKTYAAIARKKSLASTSVFYM
jgi:hypothetical protein